MYTCDFVEYLAYAKINLFFEITGKRNDGYHDIDSIMQSVDLCDRVRVTLKQSGISVCAVSAEAPHTEIVGIPNDYKNTAYKAADIFFRTAELNCGADIRIEKSIPTQAGLGGGSADAAAVIVALDELCKTRLSVERMMEIGAKVGADVPFCIAGGCRRVTGFGEIVGEAIKCPEFHVLIAKNGGGISTPAAYRLIDEQNAGFKPYRQPVSPEKMIELFNSRRSAEAMSELYNIFEDTLPVLGMDALKLKKFLLERSVGTLLSGSGSAVYALFTDKNDIQNAFDDVRREFPNSFCAMCHTVGEGMSKSDRF